jgi:predicted flap endonuclease-1-like 5' DNA nuclease
MIKSTPVPGSSNGMVAVTFSLASDRPVSLVGDFNGWDPHVHPLQAHQSADRSLCVTIDLEPGRYSFRYLADGGAFFDDPDATVESNGIGETHSVLDLTAFEPVIAEPVIAEPVIATETGAAEAGVADDLTLIDGVGPKAAAALTAGGVTTFKQLAALSVDQVKAILAAGNIKFAPTVATWAEQCRNLAGNPGKTPKPAKKTPAPSRKK